MRPITFAHRGGQRRRPENTLPPFRRALELGARGLESDARLSADGEVVLVHDAVAQRGWRRRAGRPDAPPAELAELDVPRLADLYAELGTDYELSLDLYDPAAADAGPRRGGRGRRRRPPVAVLRRGRHALVELGERATGCAPRALDADGSGSTGSLERHAAQPRRGRASTS